MVVVSGEWSGVCWGVTQASHLEVLAVDDRLPAQRGVHPGEDVLRQVQVLRRLGDAPLREERELVEHVGVAVVVAAPQRVGHRPLHQRAEAELRARREIAEQPDPREDVLAEADDRRRLRRVGGAVGELELAEGARQLEGFLQVPLLVAVDRLQDRPARERQRAVLVVTFAVAQDRHPRQLDDVGRRQPPLGVLLQPAVPIPLRAVDQARVEGLLGRRLRRQVRLLLPLDVVNVRDAQRALVPVEGGAGGEVLYSMRLCA